MEESSNASYIHDYLHSIQSTCNNIDSDTSQSRVRNCKRFKAADRWYYILLYATDTVLVLSSFVMLLLFADWILFVAPVRVIIYGISYHIISYHIT